MTLLSLPDARAVEAALFGAPGAPGLMAGAKAGTSSSTCPRWGRRARAAWPPAPAQNGVRLVDAPVSGSVSGAEAGTLAVMIGAPEGDVKPFEPIFRAIGKSLFFLGEVGKGNILKLLNNYIALTNQAALCEAMALADRLGVARQTVGEVVGKSSGASFILERKLAALVKHDYSPGFFVDLARKDLGLGLELMAETKGESVVGRAAWELYGRASEAGLGKLDSSGLLGLLEPRATP